MSAALGTACGLRIVLPGGGTATLPNHPDAPSDGGLWCAAATSRHDSGQGDRRVPASIVGSPVFGARALAYAREHEGSAAQGGSATQGGSAAQGGRSPAQGGSTAQCGAPLTLPGHLLDAPDWHQGRTVFLGWPDPGSETGWRGPQARFRRLSPPKMLRMSIIAAKNAAHRWRCPTCPAGPPTAPPAKGPGPHVDGPQRIPRRGLPVRYPGVQSRGKRCARRVLDEY